MRFASETMRAASGRGGASRSTEQLNDLRQQQLSRVLYWRSFINALLMLVDALMFLAAGAIVLVAGDGTQLLFSARLHVPVSVWGYLLACSVVYVLCLHSTGLYHRHVMGDGYQVNLLLFKAMVTCWIVQLALSALLGLTLPLGSLTLAVVVAWLLTMVERVVVRLLVTRHRERKGAWAYGTVVVGSPRGIGRMLRFLSQRQQLNYRPVAVCPIRFDEDRGVIVGDRDAAALDRQMRENWGRPLPVLTYADSQLAERMVDMQAQTVLIADVLRRYSDNFNIFSMRMETLGLEVAMVASAADASGHAIQIRSIQGTTIITQRLPQYGPASRLVKRAFDIVVSSLAIVLSSIVTIPVAIAIKATDGGPVFYTQTRIGLRGRPFRMIKFRSMVVDADKMKAELARETGQTGRFIFKMHDDPRVTPVGRFIRRFSIDELPQFLNVFVGDMSVVGPRPPLPEEYGRYSRLYATRMLVKPGITGPWQVSGRSDLSAEESEALDVSYVQNWSVLGDVVLMLRTVGAVLGHKGAY